METGRYSDVSLFRKVLILRNVLIPMGHFSNTQVYGILEYGAMEIMVQSMI